MIGALSYGELVGMMPHAGGQYVYLRESLQPARRIPLRLDAVHGDPDRHHRRRGGGVREVLRRAVPLALRGSGDCRPDARSPAAQVLAIASIVLLTWVNTRGLHGGQAGTGRVHVRQDRGADRADPAGAARRVEIGGVRGEPAAFWEAAWTRTAADGTVTTEALSGIALLAALGVAMVGSLFSSDAWNNITFTAGEVVNPKRTIALSLLMGTGTVIAALPAREHRVHRDAAGDRACPAGADVAARGIQFATSDRVGTAAASVTLRRARRR